MDSVVEILTAPSLNYKEVFNLKIHSVQEESRKSLEAFYADYEQSKRVIPENEQNYRKGLIEFLLGDIEGASRTLEENQQAQAKYFYQQAVAVLGDSTKAKHLLTEIVDQKQVQDAELRIHIALAACDTRDLDLAKKSVIGLELSNQGFQGTLIQAYLDELEGEYQDALDGYERAASEQHNLQGVALFHLARLQDLRGDDDLALATYRKIESLGIAYEEALINTGVILEDKDEYSLAVSYYERALKVNPKNERALLYYSDSEASLNMHYDERKRKQDIKTTEILNIPISDFELSVRSRNCLSKMGIFTLKDLITKTEQELLGYKNFGETSLKEIRAMLSKKGLHLGMTRVEEQPLADRIKMNAQLYSQEKAYNLDELDIPIEELDLSYRTKSALHKMGFESLRDITMRTGTDLESNPSFSAACLQEVNALLEEKGLSYRPATSSGKVEESASSVLLDDDEEDDDFDD